jgi:hypothetical protein
MPDVAGTTLQTWQIVALGVVQAIVLAIIGGVIAWVMARQTAKAKAAEKEQDWKRQDQVADRVAEAAEQTAAAAKLLADAQERTIIAAREVARLRAEEVLRIERQLSVVIKGNEDIHRLVNSDMTARITDVRDATQLTLLALRRVQAISLKHGIAIGKPEQEAIDAAEARIVELNGILAVRLEVQHQADVAAATANGTTIGKRATDPLAAIQESNAAIAAATTEAAETLKQIHHDQK